MAGSKLTVIQKGKTTKVLSSGKKTLKQKVRRIERRLTEQRPQPKFFELYDGDELIASQNSASTTSRLLCGIDEGDTDSTRNGEFIRAFHLNVKLGFYPSVVGTGLTAVDALWSIRVIVYIDRDTTLAASTIQLGAVLEMGTVTDSVLSMKNWDNRNRFRFLYDKRFEIAPFWGPITAVSNNMTTTPSIYKTIDISKKLNLPMKYNDATGTNLGKGMIYLLVLGNVTAAANKNQPAYQLSSRVLYTDP